MELGLKMLGLKMLLVDMLLAGVPPEDGQQTAGVKAGPNLVFRMHMSRSQTLGVQWNKNHNITKFEGRISVTTSVMHTTCGHLFNVPCSFLTLERMTLRKPELEADAPAAPPADCCEPVSGGVWLALRLPACISDADQQRFNFCGLISIAHHR